MCFFVPWWRVPREWVYGRWPIFVSERTNKRHPGHCKNLMMMMLLNGCGEVTAVLLLQSPSGLYRWIMFISITTGGERSRPLGLRGGSHGLWGRFSSIAWQNCKCGCKTTSKNWIGKNAVLLIKSVWGRGLLTRNIIAARSRRSVLYPPYGAPLRCGYSGVPVVFLCLRARINRR